MNAHGDRMMSVDAPSGSDLETAAESRRAPSRSTETPRRLRHRVARALARARADLAWAVLTGFGALMAITAVLRLWKANLNVPLNPGGDTTLALMIVRTMQTEGWVGSTPDLGYPLGQDLAPWPSMVGDTWHLVALKLLSTSLSPAASVNVFAILSYPLIAIVAFVCLRVLQIRAPIAGALGIAYSVLPYHLLRGEFHLFLTAYYAVPIACVLAIWLYRDQPRLFDNRRPTTAGWWALAGAVLLAGTGLYYAIFAVVIMVVTGVLSSLATRRRRPAASSAVLSGIVLAGLALAAIPNLVYLVGQGGSSAVEGRSYGATEFFGLKIVNLLLPLGVHRIPLLASIRVRAADSPIPGEGSETLGVLGAIGLVAIVIVLLMPRSVRPIVERLRPLGAVGVTAILFGTVAGLNSMLAIAGFGSMRAWNRISVVIAFVALAGVGVLLDTALAKLPAARPRFASTATILVAGMVAVIAVFDQTSDAFVPNYPANAQAWQSDAAYFGELEQDLGSGAAVFTLPLAPFPENPPIVDMPDYNHLRGFVHSDLRWSYGGVKGGDVEWQGVALEDGIAAALPRIVAAGFDAVYVNRVGYVDRGAEIEAEIREVTGADVPIVSADGALATYDIREYGERLRTDGLLPERDAVILPVRLAYGDGFYGPETDGSVEWRWAQREAQASLVNPRDEDVKVLVHGLVSVADPTATVTLTIGTETTTFTSRDGRVALDMPATLPPGQTQLTLSSNSGPTTPAVGDPRSLVQQVIGLRLDD